MAASRGLSPLPLVCAALASILFLALHPVAVDGQLIDCWKFDGTLSPNNTRCPGSNACCGPKATCLSNRLCTDHNDPNSRMPVRGPCAVEGWDDSCPQICKYDEGKNNYPRISICDDGTLCCDDDPECCEQGNGIFLDESGNIAKSRATAATTRYPPTNGVSRYTATPTGLSKSTSSTTDAATTSTTSETGTKGTKSTTSKSSTTSVTSTTRSSSGSSSDLTTASSTASSEASEASPAPTTPSDRTSDTDSATDPSSGPSTSSDDPNALKIGLGVGIPVAVLVLVGLAFLFFRRRSQAMSGVAATTAAGQYQPMGAPPAAPYAASYPTGMSAYSPGATEYSESPKPPTAAMYHPPDMHYPPAMYRQPAVEIGGQMSVEMNVPTPAPKYAQVQHDPWPQQRPHELH